MTLSVTAKTGCQNHHQNYTPSLKGLWNQRWIHQQVFNVCASTYGQLESHLPWFAKYIIIHELLCQRWTWKCSGWDSNQWPLNHQTDARFTLPLKHALLKSCMHVCRYINEGKTRCKKQSKTEQYTAHRSPLVGSKSIIQAWCVGRFTFSG